MLSCCLRWRENIESKNLDLSKTEYGEIMQRVAKKSKFTKEQEASQLLNQLGIRTPLRKIPLLGDRKLF